MSNYSTYAKKLDTAFKAAREKYVDAYDAVKKAEKRVEDAKNETDSYFKGDADVYRADCAVWLRKAEIVFEKTQENVWAAFDEIKDQLTAELKKAVAADSMAVPENIDPNGLTLLQSGILRPEELEALRVRYEDNQTMTRIVGQYAKAAAQTEQDPARREQLNMTRTQAEKGLGAVLQAWDKLMEAAKVCSGQSHGKGAPAYVLSISSQWERLTEQIIENF